MVGADAASPQPTRPLAASTRTTTFCAAVTVSNAIFTGALSGSATGMASTRRMISGAVSVCEDVETRARTFTSHLESRVEEVPQTITEQVEREHRQADGGAREQ